VDIRVILNTNVTNNKNFSAGIDITDAVLIVNENNCPLGLCQPQPTSVIGVGTSPGNPLPQYGRLVADNTLLWSAVGLLPPGTAYYGSTAFRITNVRAKAFGVAGTPPNPPSITASLLMTGPSGPIPISVPFPGPPLAIVAPGLDAEPRLPQGFESFRVRLREGFFGAFKVLGTPTLGGPYYFPPPFQEDGYPTPGSGVNHGGATQGTRFLLEFLNLPRGSEVLVPHRLQNGIFEVQRAFNTDSAGAGGCIAYLNCLPPPAGSVGPVDTSATGRYVVYEVTNTDTSQLHRIDVPVAVCQGQATSTGCRMLVPEGQLRTAQAKISLAPVSAILFADGPAPEPRFVEGALMEIPR
jgi:hypothetical protein